MLGKAGCAFNPELGLTSKLLNPLTKLIRDKEMRG